MLSRDHSMRRSEEVDFKEGNPRSKSVSNKPTTSAAKPRTIIKPTSNRKSLTRPPSTHNIMNDESSPNTAESGYETTSAAHVIEKLESLAERHETLLERHEALGTQHEVLMSRHEALLGALELLVQRQGTATAEAVAAASAAAAASSASSSHPPTQSRGGPRTRLMGSSSSASRSADRSSISEPRGTTSSSSSSGGRPPRSGLTSLLKGRSSSKQRQESKSASSSSSSSSHSQSQPHPSSSSDRRSSSQQPSSSPTRLRPATMPHRSSSPPSLPSSGSSPAKHHHNHHPSNHQPAVDHGLRVVVRKRPAVEGDVDCVECVGVDGAVLVHEAKVKVDLTKFVQTHSFSYDDVYGEHDSTASLYQQSISAHLMDNFFDGGTSTCFCFGQTASGKTFTLFGAGGGQAVSQSGSGDGGPNGGGGSHLDLDSSSGGGGGGGGGGEEGLYVIAAKEAFGRLREKQQHNNPTSNGRSGGSMVLTMSMFEIYGQKVRDLLNGSVELAALEDGKGALQLVGLTAVDCNSFEEFLQVSHVGRSGRSTSATGANATSSRSHAALLLRLVDVASGDVLGKFSLIDLAGSERGVDHESTDKQTQMEGRQINQSLLALKEVIRAKELGRSHAPFRQSRLTQVLEESLTGARCHTTVIGCVSPAQRDTQQTVNTLRYAESLSPGHAHRHRHPPPAAAASSPFSADVAISPPQTPSSSCSSSSSSSAAGVAVNGGLVLSNEQYRVTRTSFEMFTTEFEGGDEALLGSATPHSSKPQDRSQAF